MQRRDLGTIFPGRYLKKAYTLSRTVVKGEFILTSNDLFSEMANFYESAGINAVIEENMMIANVSIPQSSKEEYREGCYETVMVRSETPLRLLSMERLVGIMETDIVLATWDWASSYGLPAEKDKNSVLIYPCFDVSRHYVGFDDFSIQEMM